MGLFGKIKNGIGDGIGLNSLLPWTKDGRKMWDPGHILTPKTTAAEAEARAAQYGDVVGFGMGGPGQREAWIQNQSSLLTGADEYAGNVDDATFELTQAGNLGKGIWGNGVNQQISGGQRITDATNLDKGLAGMALRGSQQRARDLTDFGMQAAGASYAAGNNSAKGILNAGTVGAQTIMGAAAAPQSSVAEAQLLAAQDQARRDAASLAATTGRGGNAALAARQAQQALAAQGTANAANMAQLRAQEETNIRNSQIAAAQAAGGLNLDAASRASNAALTGTSQGGQFGTGALTGAASIANAGQNIAAGSYGRIGQLGAGQQQIGANMQMGGAGILGDTANAAGNLNRGMRQDNLDQFRDLGIAQSNADQGFGTNAQQRDDADQAQTTGLIGAGLSLFM